MNIAPLLNIPCTITARVDSGDTDVYGNPVIEDGTPLSTVCWVDRRGTTTDSSEKVGAEHWQVDTVDIYLPPGTPVDGHAVVTVSTGAYELLGPPHEYTHPRDGTAVYISAVGRKVT